MNLLPRCLTDLKNADDSIQFGCLELKQEQMNAKVEDEDCNRQIVLSSTEKKHLQEQDLLLSKLKVLTGWLFLRQTFSDGNIQKVGN